MNQPADIETFLQHVQTSLREGSFVGLQLTGPVSSSASLRKVEIRLSNLMALDATAQGNWGCLPEHYPATLDLVLRGDVTLGPFVDVRPLSRINETFEDLHAGRIARRPVLVPET